MSSRVSSPSLSSDNDSELSSSLNEDFPEISEGEFIPYDENLEPERRKKRPQLTDEMSRAKKKLEHDMYQGRFAGEVETNSWYVLPKQLLLSFYSKLCYTCEARWPHG